MNFRPFNTCLLASATLITVTQPAIAQVIQITDIQLQPTSAGLTVLLQTTAPSASVQPTIQQNQDQLMVEIPNAQLDLAEGIQTQRDNPTDTIRNITFSPSENNGVLITVTGIGTAPQASLTPSPEGLVLEITADAAASITDSDSPEDSTSETTEDAAPADPAKNPEKDSRAIAPLQIIVTATRTEEEINKVPRSVTVVTQEEIEAQTGLTQDVGEILGKLVPGFAPPSQSISLFGQSLRGRNVAVLIDGVPQSTSRNVFRDLSTIDPSAIERIEILRGPTAIYGDGATGGVINIITKRPTDQPLVSQTTIGIDAAAGGDAFLTGDSLGYNLQHSISGRQDNVDFLVSAALTTIGSFYDAEGDRIPPDPNGQGGFSDVERLNFLGKIGVDLNEDQRLQFTFERFADRQKTDFTTDPIVNTIPGRQKSRALEGLKLDDPQGTGNTVLNLDYNHQNLFGSQVHGQVYYRNYSSRFFPFDARRIASLGNVIFQSELKSEKWGTRLDIDTPLNTAETLKLTWGLDYIHEDTDQPVDIFDPTAFAASNGLVFDAIGSRNWTPPFRQKNLGLFAQLNWEVSDRWLINGGLRQEWVDVAVNDFTTIRGDRIGGGDLDYDATLFNIGTVFEVTEQFSVFANFAQGFSLADVGLALRNAPAGFSVASLRPEPQKVDHYEVGVRGNWDTVQASLATFYNSSSLGTTFTAPGEVVRDPQRVYGVELAVDVQPSPTWSLGGTLSLSEGDRDLNSDGDYDAPLSGFSISPLKITAYLENQTTSNWRNRLQLLYSGSRDPEGTGFGLNEVESYVVVDYISRLNLGSGTLQLGIENLFNNQYFPITSQLQTQDSSYAAARGRTVSLKYSFTW